MIKLIRKIYLIPVYLYKQLLSPILGNHCIYEPTCSSYCISAVNRHGIFYGTVISVLRVLRCNPFANGGFDPVP